MNKNIKSVWIESVEKGPVIEGDAPADDNSDVIVTFTDNSRYSSFFTYTNIERIRRKNELEIFLFGLSIIIQALNKIVDNEP